MSQPMCLNNTVPSIVSCMEGIFHSSYTLILYLGVRYFFLPGSNCKPWDWRKISIYIGKNTNFSKILPILLSSVIFGASFSVIIMLYRKREKVSRHKHRLFGNHCDFTEFSLIWNQNKLLHWEVAVKQNRHCISQQQQSSCRKMPSTSLFT